MSSMVVWMTATGGASLVIIILSIWLIRSLKAAASKAAAEEVKRRYAESQRRQMAEFIKHQAKPIEFTNDGLADRFNKLRNTSHLAYRTSVSDSE